MARIRTIKPTFFTSLTIANLTLEQRLTFIGLWTHVDDEGRCIYDPRLIKAALWPLDSRTAEDVDGDIRALTESSLITHYTLSERSYLQVNGWSEHQRVNRKTPSTFPPPEDGRITDVSAGQRALTEGSVRTHGAITEGSRQEGKGREGKGRDICASAAAERESDDSFAEWYSHYPRKKGKGQAVKAYRTAVKKVSAERLLESLKAQIPSLMSKGAEYCPYPATWLNGESWDDEIEQPPTGKRPASYPLPGTPEFAALTDEQKVRILEREQIREFNR